MAATLAEDQLLDLYFTEEKVDDFFQNKLQFPNWKHCLQQNKVEFLTHVQQKHSSHVPFQNISMAAVPEARRCTPPIEHLISNGFSGNGGICYQLNYFVHLLLKSIGFETFVVGASFVTNSLRDTHLMPVVRLGNSGDELYLLDVAGALPLDTPVPLHSLPHQVKSAGFHYEFRECGSDENGNMTYGRFQIGGSFFQGPFKDLLTTTPAHLRFSFTLTPRSYDFFEHQMYSIFTNPLIANHLRCPFLFRYLKNEYEEPEGKEWILVFGMRMVLATTNERHVLQFADYAELEPILLKFFPNLNGREMKLAFDWFNSVKHLLREPV